MIGSSRAALLALTGIGLAACTNAAFLMQPPGTVAPADPNAPVNQRALPGVVTYDNFDSETDVAQERADAYKRMSEVCRGPYRIDDEGPELEGRKRAWLIHFSCVAADSADARHD
ncbi:MAG TPA: hypothetical protein VGR59_12980 [Gemmatimonadaceae bacterium]|nr:hypothetical protein [Gemmatimonadaceae bacterium]